MEKSWVLAFRYANMESAKVGWERVRDLILLHDCDASVYRSQIDGVAHVVIVGWDTVTNSLLTCFEDVCSNGRATGIPEAVRGYLIERRNQSAIPGAFWERRGTS